MANHTKYSEAVRQIIARLAARGDTDQEIADTVGVTVRTIYNWQSRYPELKAAMAEAKELPDDSVEASLFHRAIGYSHEAVKLFFDAKSGKVVEHKYIEHYPPDTVAAIFWLKARRWEEWNDRRNDKPDVTINQYDKMSEEQLANLLKELEAKRK